LAIGIAQKHRPSIWLLFFAIPYEHEIRGYFNEAFNDPILIKLDWHNAIVLIENVMSMSNIIQVRTHNWAPIIMYYYSSPMLLKCFRSTHIHRIFIMTEVHLTFLKIPCRFAMLDWSWREVSLRSRYWSRQLSHL